MTSKNILKVITLFAINKYNLGTLNEFVKVNENIDLNLLLNGLNLTNEQISNLLNNTLIELFTTSKKVEQKLDGILMLHSNISKGKLSDILEKSRIYGILGLNNFDDIKSELLAKVNENSYICVLEKDINNNFLNWTKENKVNLIVICSRLISDFSNKYKNLSDDVVLISKFTELNLYGYDFDEFCINSIEFIAMSISDAVFIDIEPLSLKNIRKYLAILMSYRNWLVKHDKCEWDYISYKFSFSKEINRKMFEFFKEVFKDGFTFNENILNQTTELKS